MIDVARRRDETRRSLLDGAFTVFAAKGFGHTRIDDICKASGFTKGAFYSNFASLEELFFALYREQSRSGVEHTLRVLATPADDLHDVIELWADGLPIDRDWWLINCDFVLHAARHPDVAADLAAERSALRESLTRCLATFIAAQPRSTLPPTLSTPHELARALVTLFDGTLAQLLLDMDEPAVRRHFAAVATALLRP